MKNKYINRAICVSDCSGVVPASGFNTCGPEDKKGGIDRFIYKACDATFSSIVDTAEWTTKLTAHAIHSTGKVIGSKAKPAYTKKKFSSSGAEQITGGSTVFTYRDFNVTTQSFTFYNTLNTDSSRFGMGHYSTANGEFTGWYNDISVEAGLVVEEDSQTGSAYWDVTVTVMGITEIAPTSIPTLETVLVS